MQSTNMATTGVMKGGRIKVVYSSKQRSVFEYLIDVELVGRVEEVRWWGLDVRQ